MKNVKNQKDEIVNTMVAPLEKLLNMEETRDILGVSRSTLYSWICKRKIRVIKMGSKSMFMPSDIWNFIRKQAKEPIKIG